MSKLFEFSHFPTIITIFASMKVLLDANILYPPTLRDLFLCLADQQIIIPYWSKKILSEWTSSISKTLNPSQKLTLQKIILEMNEKFPKSEINGFENLIETLKLHDADDRHVFAAAIYAKVDFILTFNTRDFPKSALRKHGILPVHPDKFLCDLMRTHPHKIYETLQTQIKIDRYNGISIGDTMFALHNRGLIKSMRLLKDYIQKK